MEATETKRNGIAMTHGRESCSRPLWRKPGCDFAVTENSQFKGKARQGKARQGCAIYNSGISRD